MTGPTLHDDALTTLSGWIAPTLPQESLRERYVDHLHSHPDGLARSCRPDHLTASTLVLSPDGGQVLLTLHAKAQRWFQFGGHCEDGDRTLAAAATREAAEESGIPGIAVDPVPLQLSEHEVPFCGERSERVVHHLDVRFLAVVGQDKTPRVSEESLAVRWWPVDDLPHADPDLVELVALGRERARARQSISLGGGSSRAAADQPSR